jgi:hypothetical protein
MQGIKETVMWLGVILFVAFGSFWFFQCTSPLPNPPVPPTITGAAPITHIPSRTLVPWTPTKKATSTLTRTATRTLSPSSTATSSTTATDKPTSTSTASSTATPSRTPTLPTIPSGRNTLTPPVPITPLIPTGGGEADPSKCESGYQPQLGIIGKDIVIYLNCLDDERAEGMD